MTALIYRSEEGTLLCAGCGQKAISFFDDYHDICTHRIPDPKYVELLAQRSSN